MKKTLIVLLGLMLFCWGCGKKENKVESVKVRQITLGAYTVPKEAYQKAIIPAFQNYWLKTKGEKVEFFESYIASGAQSRAIVGGFEADVAALSLEQDVQRLAEVGLITHNWKDNKYKGMVTRSVVVIVTRPGNPKKIKDWQDLAKSDIDVLYPSPKTSGGAMWDVNAIYGAGLKMTEVKNGKMDLAFARKLLKGVQSRVKVMDKSGRESVTTFESGVGDALVTYENEALLRQMQGKDFPFIIPQSTLLIENPVAVVDKNVELHKNRDVVEAFVNFLWQPQSQRYFADYGFRSVDETVAAEYAAKYPQPELLFDMNYLGGWPKVNEEIYGENGVWTLIVSELGAKK